MAAQATTRPSPPSGSSVHTLHMMHVSAQSPFFSAAPGPSGRSASPMPSPRAFSAGQPLPPKASPARASEARSPSPNYFALVPEPVDPRDSGALQARNWSPASSGVKPFAAALPMPVPLHANPEFEEFKRQADLRTRMFGLAGPTGMSAVGVVSPGPQLHSPSAAPPRPRMARWGTFASNHQPDGGLEHGLTPTRTPGGVWERSQSRMDLDSPTQRSERAPVEANRGPDLSGASAWPPISLLRMPPPPSHAPSPRVETTEGYDKRTSLSKVEDRDPRLSVMGNRLEMASPPLGQPRPRARPGTVPAKIHEGGPIMIAPSQLRALLEDGLVDQVLLLDIRSAQTFSQSHIMAALNLCVPTTLLKRASYNLWKLEQNFYNSADKERFTRWAVYRYVVVYDAHSTETTEAAAAVNMAKKFTNEGYQGQTSILRGGFNAFQAAYPELIWLPGDMDGEASNTEPSSVVAPVIGGFSLPAAATTTAINPFFGNIRQNTDLADGVGQMEVSLPPGAEPLGLPRWLRSAASQADRGKGVSDKFLAIEREEQSRMQHIYTSFGAWGTQQPPCVSISGLEQGVKNRYKDILPFEHSRVKLQGRPAGACDYVNASHVRASRSYKRYIATQGPLPATFDDFWSVVWDQDVRVIVMLTAESEGGQVKCHTYWTAKEYGSIRLKLLSERKVSLDPDRHRAAAAADPNAASDPPRPPFGRRRANTTMTSLGASSAAPAPSGAGAPPAEPPHYVIVRKFALSHAAHPFSPIREITHLHYPSWPDFGAPARPSHLLALVELSNVMHRSAPPVDTSAATRGSAMSSPEPAQASWAPQSPWNDKPETDPRSRPMLVHCSAGCGRTGAFCAVDSVIDMLRRQRHAKSTPSDVAMGGDQPTTSPRTSDVSSPTPPAAIPSPTAPLDTSWLDDDSVDLLQLTVEDFRRQRMSMVQSLRQFVLCYETVLEWAWRANARAPTSGPVTSGGGGEISEGGGGIRTRSRTGSLGIRGC